MTEKNLQQKKLFDTNPKSTSTLTSAEQQKFSTYNPLLSDNIRFKRMYWTSRQEKVGRIMMLTVAILLLVLNFFLATWIINDMLTKLNIITTSSNYKPWFTILIVFVFTFAFDFLIVLPMAISRTATTIFNWSVFFIILAIGYFILIEVFYLVLLVLNGLIDQSMVQVIPYFMILSLVLTIIWIIASCLLLVKSDDIAKQLSVE